jgi:hypothetical protein
VTSKEAVLMFVRVALQRLLEAHRTLVTEGKVTLAERKTKSQWMLCLFNDIIVPAKLQRYTSTVCTAHVKTHSHQHSLSLFLERGVARDHSGEIMPQLTVPLTLTWLHAEVQGTAGGLI